MMQDKEENKSSSISNNLNNEADFCQGSAGQGRFQVLENAGEN